MGSSNQRKFPKKRRKKRNPLTGKDKYSVPKVPKLNQVLATHNLPMDLTECLFFLSISLMDRYTTYFLAHDYPKEEAVRSSIYSLRNFAHWLQYGIGEQIHTAEYELAMGFVLQ